MQGRATRLSAPPRLLTRLCGSAREEFYHRYLSFVLGDPCTAMPMRRRLRCVTSTTSMLCLPDPPSLQRCRVPPWRSTPMSSITASIDVCKLRRPRTDRHWNRLLNCQLLPVCLVWILECNLLLRSHENTTAKSKTTSLPAPNTYNSYS